MGLFNSTCCPPKPRRTVDYILNWIDKYGPIITKDTSYINDLLDWRRTVENDLDGYVKNAADEYITNYDWSQVPEFNAKADKVKNVTAGNLASLDSNGNLIDSGVNYDESIEEGNHDLATCNAVYVALQTKADKVVGATTGNLASFDEEGNPQDSGMKPSDFAPASGSTEYAAADHDHNYIADFSGSYNCGASVSVGESDPGTGVISLIVKGNGQSTDSKTAEIDYSNIDNLNRALQDPDTTPTSGSNNLITSGAVYTELGKKASSSQVSRLIERLERLESLINFTSYSIAATVTGSGTTVTGVKINDLNIIHSSSSSAVELQNLDGTGIYELANVGDNIKIVSANNVTVLDGTITDKMSSYGGEIVVSSGFSASSNISDGTGTITLYRAS